MPMTFPAVYSILKPYLANRAGFEHPMDIKADMSLDGHPLLYTAAGKRGLAGALNASFEKPPRTRGITKDQTGAAKTVRDLAKLVMGAHK